MKVLYPGYMQLFHFTLSDQRLELTGQDRKEMWVIFKLKIYLNYGLPTQMINRKGHVYGILTNPAYGTDNHELQANYKICGYPYYLSVLPTTFIEISGNI